MSLTSYRAAPSRDIFGSFLSGYDADEAFVLIDLSRGVFNRRGLLEPAMQLIFVKRDLRFY